MSQSDNTARIRILSEEIFEDPDDARELTYRKDVNVIRNNNSNSSHGIKTIEPNSESSISLNPNQNKSPSDSDYINSKNLIHRFNDGHDHELQETEYGSSSLSHRSNPFASMIEECQGHCKSNTTSLTQVPRFYRITLFIYVIIVLYLSLLTIERVPKLELEVDVSSFAWRVMGAVGGRWRGRNMMDLRSPSSLNQFQTVTVAQSKESSNSESDPSYSKSIISDSPQQDDIDDSSESDSLTSSLIELETRGSAIIVSQMPAKDADIRAQLNIIQANIFRYRAQTMYDWNNYSHALNYANSLYARQQILKIQKDAIQKDTNSFQLLTKQYATAKKGLEQQRLQDKILDVKLKDAQAYKRALNGGGYSARQVQGVIDSQNKFLADQRRKKMKLEQDIRTLTKNWDAADTSAAEQATGLDGEDSIDNIRKEARRKKKEVEDLNRQVTALENKLGISQQKLKELLNRQRREAARRDTTRSDEERDKREYAMQAEKEAFKEQYGMSKEEYEEFQREKKRREDAEKEQYARRDAQDDAAGCCCCGGGGGGGGGDEGQSEDVTAQTANVDTGTGSTASTTGTGYTGPK